MKNLKKHPLLAELIERFIEEHVRTKQVSLRMVHHFYNTFVHGDGDADLSPYLSYLVAVGIRRPRAAHLSNKYIEPYFEYLRHHHGLLRQREIFLSLRVFWKWCQAEGFLADEVKIPADLLLFPKIDSTFDIQVFLNTKRSKGDFLMTK